MKYEKQNRLFETIERPGIFRLFLAFMVFIDHTTRFNFGTAAVYIFFILSGYWIASMWRGRYSMAKSPYATYIISRLWRLLPVFILCSIISWSVAIHQHLVPSAIEWTHQIISNFAILGYKTLIWKPNGPAWSLDIEVQFYIVAPVIIILLSREIKWLVSVIILSIFSFYAGDQFTVLPYLAFFSIGISSNIVKWKPSPTMARTTLGLTILLVLIFVMTHWSGVLLGGAHPGPLHTYNGYSEIILALLMAPWAIYTTGRSDSELDGIFGDLSYPFYLLHWPILQCLDMAAGNMLQRVTTIGEALVMTSVGSLSIWYLFDRPINFLRNQWVKSQLARRASR